MTQDEFDFEIANIRANVLRFKHTILIPFLLEKHGISSFNPNQRRVPAGDASGDGGEWITEEVAFKPGRGERKHPTKPHGNHLPAPQGHNGGPPLKPIAPPHFTRLI